MNINDVRGILIVVAGILVIAVAIGLLFWKDNRKGVRLFKRAKKSTIAALVSQCKEMSQDAGNDGGEIYLGDYILKGNANASMCSRGARKQCVFYDYSWASYAETENDEGKKEMTIQEAHCDTHAAPFTLTQDSASIEVIPFKDKEKDKYKKNYQYNYIGLQFYSKGGFGKESETEYYMEPGELTVAGSVYCRNGKLFIEMHRKSKRIIVSNLSSEDTLKELSKKANKNLITILIMILVAIACVVVRHFITPLS